MGVILIEGDNHLATLGNCGGYYSCPKSPDGKRLGPLVGYAGKYDGPDGKKLQFIGDIYANFAKAEVYPHVLKFFALGLAARLDATVGLPNIDVVCGAPIGGYSLADVLGLTIGAKMIKAEKKVTAIATADSREQSELVFARHSIEPGERVAIIEDVCNNFSTTGTLIDLIIGAGGKVVAIACFLNRSMNTTAQYYTEKTGTIHVVNLVCKSIIEYKQDDLAVAEDVAKGNVVWKPKNEWGRLMQAMADNPQ